MEIKHIRKRDGSVQPFELDKIESAVLKALYETEEGEAADAAKVSELVHKKTIAMCVQAATASPEDILILLKYTLYIETPEKSCAKEIFSKKEQA